MRRLLAVLIIVAAGCGGAGEQPTCDDPEHLDAHYRECVGPHEFERHRERVLALVHDLRDVSANPAEMGDTMRCDTLPTHVCREGDGAKCEWAAAQRQDTAGAKYHALCFCMSDEKAQQAAETCDGV